MIKTFLALLALTVVLVFAAPSGAWCRDGNDYLDREIKAREVGRFQVVATQLKERDGVLPCTVMVDTITGRSWYLTSGFYWQPLTVLDSLPKVYHDERINDQEMKYFPSPAESVVHPKGNESGEWEDVKIEDLKEK